MPSPQITDEEIETSLVFFAEQTLGLELYGWQIEAIEPFDELSERLVQVSVSTPNGAGKGTVVITTLILGVLAMYPRARVVLTTADGKQLDGQVMPALHSHRHRFPSWTFLEREIRTPTGGRFVAFTTDDPGRAEGWHKENDMEGPLLFICDEAKSIPEAIFTAVDRCTFNAILLASSPGAMIGRFYETQTKPELGFQTIKVGLLDCPHITQDKIDRIVAIHGPDSPFTKSALHGEFMLTSGEARFNYEGIKRLLEMSKAQDKLESRDPLKAQIGWLEEGKGLQAPIVWTRDDSGPFWIVEPPKAGCSYIGFGDPATGEQAEGSATRDGCSGGIMRLGYTDEKGIEHPDEPVAFLHGHDFTDVHWDNDVVAESLDILLRFYGDPPINIEANNAGVEVIRLLQMSGRMVCRRRRRDHKHPGKLTEIVGFQTNAASKMEWVGALAGAIREQTMDVRYLPAANHLSTFILDDKGRGQAQSGCRDDHVTGLGLALLAKHWAKVYLPINQHTIADQLPGVQHYWREPIGIGGAWS